MGRGVGPETRPPPSKFQLRSVTVRCWASVSRSSERSPWPGGKPKVTTAVPVPRIIVGIMELTHLVPVKQREKIPKWARAPQCLLTKLLRLWRKYLDLEIGYQFSAFNQETQHFHQTRRSGVLSWHPAKCYPVRTQLNQQQEGGKTK